MGDKSLLVERLGSVLVARMHRPGELNALDPGLVQELDAMVAGAESDDELRIVVLTGVGRAFCPGADLKFMNQASPEVISRFLDDVMRLFNRLEELPKPVIAAVNGLALAGGLELVLCCDLVIAAQSARMGDAHSKYGLMPTGGASIRLPRRIGITRAKYLLYTGELVSSSDLLTAGLVNRVVPDEDLERQAFELAASLADRSPLALRRMKLLVRDGAEQPVASGIRLESLVSDIHRRSEDCREGLTAFNEKRNPTFLGR